MRNMSSKAFSVDLGTFAKVVLDKYKIKGYTINVATFVATLRRSEK